LKIYTPTELRDNLYQTLKQVQQPGEIVYVHSGKTSDYDVVVISKQTWDEVQSVINNKEKEC
jgi:PHD/YefM family antitoxin component YafN of YafNO toxin-antitoxin module